MDYIIEGNIYRKLLSSPPKLRVPVTCTFHQFWDLPGYRALLFGPFLGVSFFVAKTLLSTSLPGFTIVYLFLRDWTSRSHRSLLLRSGCSQAHSEAFAKAKEKAAGLALDAAKQA